MNLRSPADAVKCQVVFISSEKSSSSSELKDYLENKSCLVISEKEGVSHSGIEFIKKNDKLGFKINENTLRTHKLIISQQLMKMSI